MKRTFPPKAVPPGDTSRIPIAIYDGQCGICLSFKNWLKNHSQKEAIRFIPFQEADFATIPGSLTLADVRQAFCLISENGRTFRGARAVFESLKFLPLPLKIVGHVFSLPPISLLCEPGYRYVAKYRRRISGWFGLQKCDALRN